MTTAAPAGEWHMLADRVVEPGVNRHVIAIEPNLSALARLRIDPRGGDLTIHSVEATDDGGPRQLSGKLTIRSGDPSPIIGIGGTGIRELVLTYEAGPPVRGRTMVAVFGETASADRAR